MTKDDPHRKKRIAMVENQISSRGITDERILNVMRQIPRHLFVQDDDQDDAYTDHPLPIGNNQTISQPYIVALMTSLMDLSGSEKILEIGTGSGYQTAVLSRLAREVYSVELIKTLSERAAGRLDLLGLENVRLHVGDGSSGWEKYQPYDRIMITAATPDISKNVLEQVRVNGKIVAPIGERWNQTLEVWERKEDGFVKEKILPVVFVPLKGRFGWQD